MQRTQLYSGCSVPRCRSHVAYLVYFIQKPDFVAAEFDGLISCWCIFPGTLSRPLSLDYGPFFRRTGCAAAMCTGSYYMQPEGPRQYFTRFFPFPIPPRISTMPCRHSGVPPSRPPVSCCSRLRHAPSLSASAVFILFALFPVLRVQLGMYLVILSPCTAPACFCFVPALLRLCLLFVFLCSLK